jgi:hypothetical protein
MADDGRHHGRPSRSPQLSRQLNDAAAADL